MTVQLINVGRNDINKTIVVKSVNELEKQVGKYIMSRQWDFEPTEVADTYDVVAGFRTIGQVKILNQ